ncbi:MAG: SDR family oxidoreductase [Saprospiraceae bacterium]|nr:SDR family oxidoreductase [Saprospiraceae bacterium]
MNKTVVVTGGTKGLGRAIAEIFAQNGFEVCVCARTQADLDEMQHDWAQLFPGRRLLTYAADVSKKADVFEFAGHVREQWPRLDVLVNNAGIFLPGAISEEREGTLETLLETNLYSAYHLTRALLPLMLPQKSGHIFNMCSIASIIAYPDGGSYSISKFALLGFSKVLREELKPRGIKVTALLPGATWSDSWRGADYPENRLMKAEDIAKTLWAAYTLSDSAVVEEVLIRPQLGDL